MSSATMDRYSHDKTRHRSRSGDRHHSKDRSRSRERYRSSSGSSDSSRSAEKKKGHRKHKHRSRSRERSHKHKSHHKSRDRSESSDDSDSSDTSTGRKNHKRKHKHRSRSRDRSKRKRCSRSRSREKRKHSKPVFDHLTLEDMEKLKEKRKKEKEKLKSMETPEEKRARRLAKKEAKDRKRKEKMGWDDEYMGYSNADNPFGDEHLWDTFVWQKKLEKEGKESLSKNILEKMQKQKMIESKLELEKVKKRRLEREKEREERELEREMMQRQKEAEYFREWETQEDNFHLKQAKMRSKIRIEDGRAKPIDLLAKYISAEDDDLAIEMHEPYTCLNGLTIADLEDLLEDITVYMELEQGRNAEYWRDITIIVEEEVKNLKKIDPNSIDYIGERRTGINQSVTNDVVSVFKGKTISQLGCLEESIKNKLKGGEGVDVGYWESLLQQLKAHMARTRLRERHQDELRRKLFKLKQEQGIESAPLFPILRDETASDSGESHKMGGQVDRDVIPDTTEQPGPSEQPPQTETAPSTSHTEDFTFTEPTPSSSMQHQSEPEDNERDEDEAIVTEQDLLEQRYEEYEAVGYSPVRLKQSDLEPDTLVYDPEVDMKRLEYARLQVMKTGQARKDEEDELVKKAREGMNDEEAQFSVEVPLEKQTLLWSDKYRPRKPRFFNRVHTGFEWNKYNQTHYDIDNPPPKIVQGYKFNIFYPDLIDKADTPQYHLTPCDDNKDFAALRFSSGPPYEDIAFKIVNREWEYSYKRGFRCQFHNNIFQLWFHFKRYRYRR